MSTWRPSDPDGREREPRRVGESLDRVTGSIGAPRASTLSVVFTTWERFVGEEIAAHATPRSLREGVLVVDVDEPAWAAQLGYMSSQILAKLQADVGPGEIADIRFAVAGANAPRGRRKTP